jgi:hypothetical protein
LGKIVYEAEAWKKELEIEAKAKAVAEKELREKQRTVDKAASVPASR